MNASFIFRRILWSFTAVAGFASFALAADLTLALTKVETTPDQTGLSVEVVAFNRTDTTIAPDHWLEAEIPVTIRSGEDSWKGSLIRQETPAGSITMGSFLAIDYHLDLPAGATGRLTLEARPRNHPPLAGIATVEPARKLLAGTGSTPEPDTASDPTSTTALDTLQRAYLGHFSPHEPIYFIYGPDAPAAKFQFSFKYLLAALGEPTPEKDPLSLQFAFTQRSLWDIKAESSPFYDSSYMPEVFLEKLTIKPETTDRLFTWLGTQTGYRHESNGQADNISRSLNVLFARAAFVIGDPKTWHFVGIPEVFGYIGDLGGNPDIEDYRGYGRFRLVLSHGPGATLTADWRSGTNFENVTTQLDLNIPVRVKHFNIGSYLLIQYFNGYGESLRSYQIKSDSLRAGLSFVR